MVPGIISTRYLTEERALCMLDRKHQTDTMLMKMVRGMAKKNRSVGISICFWEN